MSEINTALGASGVGHTITIPLEGEEQLKDEIAEMEAIPKDSISEDTATQFVADLQAKKDKLAMIQTMPHVSLTFMPLTKRKQAKYEEFMEHRVRDEAWESRRYLLAKAKQLRKQAAMDDSSKTELEMEALAAEQQAAKKMDDADKAIAAGEYSFVSENQLQFTRTPLGQMFFLRLLLEDKQPNLTDDDLEDYFHNHYELMTQAAITVNDMGK